MALLHEPLVHVNYIMVRILEHSKIDATTIGEGFFTHFVSQPYPVNFNSCDPTLRNAAGHVPPTV